MPSALCRELVRLRNVAQHRRFAQIRAIVLPCPKILHLTFYWPLGEALLWREVWVVRLSIQADELPPHFKSSDIYIDT